MKSERRRHEHREDHRNRCVIIFIIGFYDKRNADGDGAEDLSDYVDVLEEASLNQWLPLAGATACIEKMIAV